MRGFARTLGVQVRSSVWPQTTARPVNQLPGYGPDFVAELRRAFTPPFSWLRGVLLNAVLSVIWLAIFPVVAHRHEHVAVLVTQYVATFILADVTTTNVLGSDADHVLAAQAVGTPVRRLLLLKNIVLLTIVGIPMMVLATTLTVQFDRPSRLLTALPGVALWMLLWVGAGNVASVLIPSRPRSLRSRWTQRRDFVSTAHWAIYLAVPALLYYPLDLIDRLPRWAVRQLPGADRGPGVHAVVVLAFGFAMWALGILVAHAAARRPETIRGDSIEISREAVV